MVTVSYITPIMNRTQNDVNYARLHQDDLVNKNIGAWNYTDMNRICNNLKYAAEHMYEKGFLNRPYEMQIKLDWKETDIITYEQLNSMIVNNLNNLKTYSRPDLHWFYIASIANMDYSLANWIERDIHALATQEPMPLDAYKLTVEKGSGSGSYKANEVVAVQADPPEEGLVFDRWSGDHLENIGNASAAITTYKMPHQDITLTANYVGITAHVLTVKTHTKTETFKLSMGDVHFIEADPAPQGKVFHHWEVEPDNHKNNLYEPAATTRFTMPNEDVTLTAIYITKGKKQLNVINGKGSGWYEYDSHVSVSSDKPSDGTFTSWSGDTQYLTQDSSEEFNSIKIPDVNYIEIQANWTTPSVPPTPPAENISLKVENGTISSTGETEGLFTQYETIPITANPAPEGYVFSNWVHEGGGSIESIHSPRTNVTIGSTDMIVTAQYRQLEYHKLTVTTHSSTTTKTLEAYDYFSVDANPAPDGYTFDTWRGDTYSFNSSRFEPSDASTGTYMGTSDRTLEATYREIKTHTLTVKLLSGDVTYTQDEFTTVNITAEDAPAGQRFVRWSLSGEGKVSSKQSKTTTFTFGNGDAILAPVYVNIWTITVINGTINKKESAVLDEGDSYELSSRGLAVYERFDGWTQDGPGSIYNTAATKTTFTVGKGDVTITANISNYPDRTLTIYKRDPDTNKDTLISEKTYTHGTNISIEAPIAPNKTTFSSWLGDVDVLHPSALASSVIATLDKDVSIIATYYYPESPQYYTLTVYDGYPESGSYATGSQITIRAKNPNQDWEFYKWYGDTQFLVNPDLTLSENSVIMPLKSITLYAKFKVIGELPLYRVSVINGTAKGKYIDEKGETHEYGGEKGSVYIDVPAGTVVTLTADPNTVGFVFDYWSGNFEAAGVTDIVATNNPAVFTMTEHDLNITMNRRELDKYIVYPTNATGPGEVYPGTYPIVGNLFDTDDKHYTFEHWTCVDADKNDCISAIEDLSNVSTNITLTDKDLWVEAVYTTHYKLTIIEGQDNGDGYYSEGEIVNTVYANTPPEGSNLQFDHWEDPTGIIKNIYDPTPTIIMKDSVATITAVFVSTTGKGNSVVVTGDNLHSGIITRSNTTLINGVFAIGTIVFDRDGCVGIITQTNPDSIDDTDDYKVEKLFYGGNL